MSDKKKPAPQTEATEPAVDAIRDAQRETKPDDAAAKSSYVFKIVPADPKNNFDFEDVADK